MTDCKLCVHKPVCDLWRSEEHQDASFFSRTDDECEFFLVERRWIPVAERFPEKAGTYFVATKTGAVTFARFYPEHDFIDCTGKFISHEKGKFQSNRNVIYWIPLPEPPKED